ncbi:sodium/potassium-transporting ATPase subunit beta-1-like [Pseudomyrmex gracilis]|uniref:sodium/potassium-transporting ATPase subunit beta-1-like n=1 Tax=Pseudomyrmex gracilis TaxID=219809 RepID=UPI000994A525|nr:sodium/potassium-transporting ATPase subunit beta-1-like [Pseudomyrmex gracilis]
MVILHDEEYYESRKPEPDLGPVRNFLRFVWNPQRRTLLGRKGKEWVELGIFYLCFLSVLSSIFVLQMWISIQYVSKLDKPFFLYEGLVSTSVRRGFPFYRQFPDFYSPGIDFKPNTVLPTTSPIIWIDNSSTNARPKRYIEALNNFLQGMYLVLNERRVKKKLLLFCLEYNKSKENYKTVAECNNGVFGVKPCLFDVESLEIQLDTCTL